MESPECVQSYRVRPPDVGGSEIANSRGVPGTLGCVARTMHDGGTVSVLCHHVLFGDGAREGEPVWLVVGGTAHPFGRSRYGRHGTVSYGGADVHVDCAVATVDDTTMDSTTGGDLGPVGSAAPGLAVSKAGAATGTTFGVVVGVASAVTATTGGRVRSAPGQILVRPAAGAGPFSAEGDSGAMLRGPRGEALGLLWGTNARGESIACPIRPVLAVLGIDGWRKSRVDLR